MTECCAHMTGLIILIIVLAIMGLFLKAYQLFFKDIPDEDFKKMPPIPPFPPYF